MLALLLHQRRGTHRSSGIIEPRIKVTCRALPKPSSLPASRSCLSWARASSSGLACFHRGALCQEFQVHVTRFLCIHTIQWAALFKANMPHQSCINLPSQLGCDLHSPSSQSPLAAGAVLNSSERSRPSQQLWLPQACNCWQLHAATLGHAHSESADAAKPKPKLLIPHTIL